MVVLVGQCRRTPLHPFLSILLPVFVYIHASVDVFTWTSFSIPFPSFILGSAFHSSDGATKDMPGDIPRLIKGRPTLISFCSLYFDVFGSNDGQNNSQGFQHLGTAGWSSIFKWPKIWAEELTSSFRPLSGSFHLFSRVSFILFLNIVQSILNFITSLVDQLPCGYRRKWSIHCIPDVRIGSARRPGRRATKVYTFCAVCVDFLSIFDWASIALTSFHNRRLISRSLYRTNSKQAIFFPDRCF